MIEPVRHQHAYDLSCSACGVVERFADMRFDYFILRAKSLGWMIGTPRAARDCLCPQCIHEIPLRTSPGAQPAQVAPGLDRTECTVPVSSALNKPGRCGGGPTLTEGA